MNVIIVLYTFYSLMSVYLMWPIITDKLDAIAACSGKSKFY